MATRELLHVPRHIVINKDASLADGSRAMGEFNNKTGATDGDASLWATLYLKVQFDTTAPTAGDRIADVYVLHGDGSESFPNGGDGTGSPASVDVDPTVDNRVGSFITASPSTSADEIIQLGRKIELEPRTVRIVVKNVSGQTFDATWELWLVPTKESIA